MSTNSACVRKARKNAPSYKPTADRLCRSVNQLKKEVCSLETEVDANTAAIEALQNGCSTGPTGPTGPNGPSVISFALDSNVSVPDSSFTLIDNWNVLETTNEFSPTDYSAGLFTAPSTGIYHVTANMLWNETTITTPYPVATYINVNNANNNLAFNNAVTESFTSQIISVPIPITIGDTISVEVGQESSQTVTLSAFNGTTSWSIIKY